MAEREQPPPDFGSSNSEDDAAQEVNTHEIADEDNNLHFEQPELEEEPFFHHDSESTDVGANTSLKIQEPIRKEAATVGGASAAANDTKTDHEESNGATTQMFHQAAENVSSEQSSKEDPPAQSVDDEVEDNEVDTDGTIEITVSDPEKTGEGMSAYYKYTVTTKTNFSYFKKPESKVKRRFSDFLALFSRLNEKYGPKGIIVPPAPEKSMIGNTKAKFSEQGSSSDFVERRRAALERFILRTASHPSIRKDPELLEFLENEQDLPHATNMSALSVGGLKRFAKNIGQHVEKITSKTPESDRWFEERSHQLENLELQMKKLYECILSLVHARKDMCKNTADFAKACAMLSNAEENTGLSHALTKLADVEEKIDHLMQEQANKDFFLLAELLSDYIRLLSSVKTVFHERMKFFGQWQSNQNTLTKKRENEAKLQASGKTEKLQQVRQEIKEWEVKVEKSQKVFDNISNKIRSEMERFEKGRVKEFRDAIIRYVESLLHTQQELISYWEGFVPEVQTIA